ncbi:hypothetical protein [Amycolatopsis sp. NPDC051128]|uniref:terminase small subunit n=1 Tax=Amycolatopsis sp. NPDC051128 TaxID=3155412 RepID=UPI0034306087
MSMCAAVAAALAGVQLAPADAAAVALAQQYAAAIDAAAKEPSEASAAAENDGRVRDPLATYGPKLLAVLDALGLTPRGRAASPPLRGGQRDGTGPAGEPVDPLDELRQLRDTRAHRAAAVDTTTA